MQSSLASFSGNAPATQEMITESEMQCGARFPDDYIAFMKRRNGGEGFVGENSYLMLWNIENIHEYNREYEVANYCPNLILFGSSGGGEAYAFDKRVFPWCVVEVPFIGMDYSLCNKLGNSFEEFLLVLSQR